MVVKIGLRCNFFCVGAEKFAEDKKTTVVSCLDIWWRTAVSAASILNLEKQPLQHQPRVLIAAANVRVSIVQLKGNVEEDLASLMKFGPADAYPLPLPRNRLTSEAA